MRRLQLATLLLATTSLIVCGCRQTTGPTTAGASTTLAPVGAGQVPTLNPFGGATRVTPPATGSYVAPNNYMGGTMPAPQASTGVNSAGGFAASPGNVVGSGVQVAGWNETGANIPPPTQGFAPSPPPTSAFGTNAAPPTNPRGGGMQVIDLTRAPPPPGYRPTAPAYNPQIPTPPQTYPTPSIGAPVQSFQNGSFQNGAVQNQGFQSIAVPNEAEIASRLTPLPPSTPSTAQGPSTEPVNTGNGTGSDQNLPWRRPGTQY